MTPLFIIWEGTDEDETRVLGDALVDFDRPVATAFDIKELQARLKQCDGVPSNAIITNWRRMEDPA